MIAFLHGLSGPLLGASAEAVRQDLGHIGPTAIAFFFVFITLSLGITYWAARRTRSASDFYAAGHSVTGVQNGFALAGDYMSAASFLGITGLVAKSGFRRPDLFHGLSRRLAADAGAHRGVVARVGQVHLRRRGAYRLSHKPVRVSAAVGTIAVVLFYLDRADGRSAGQLIRLLFGIQYEWAIGIVGAGDDDLCALRRHDRHDLGADHQGGAAAGRGDVDGAARALAKFGFNPLSLFAQAAEDV